MSRRRRAEKRAISLDIKFNSEVIQKFINKVMRQGKKTIAQNIVYNALEQFAKKVSIESPVQAFEQALENAKPALEVKSRRIGGATYQVPVEIAPGRRSNIAMSWIIENAKGKVGKNMVDGLVIELYDCFNNQGSTIKKKDDMHKMAEANKAFAHYKW